jgi:hypothetical protein
VLLSRCQGTLSRHRTGRFLAHRLRKVSHCAPGGMRNCSAHNWRIPIERERVSSETPLLQPVVSSGSPTNSLSLPGAGYSRHEVTVIHASTSASVRSR